MSRRPMALVLLLGYLPACTGWHVEKEVSPQQLIATARPNVVRVTRADSSHLVLHQPTITAGDSLSGVHEGAPTRVAIADVTQVEIRKVSAVRTIALVVAIPAVAIGTFFAIFLSNCGHNC